jgi:23S rRNA (pseudouridine1915-N3)-methyltransferase
MSALGGLEEVIVKPAKTAGRDLSPEEIRRTLEKEGEEIKKTLSLPKYAKSYKIALCIEGTQLSSEGLAKLLGKVALEGKSNVCFLIGGSWGLHESVKALCDFRLSFSPMTFAHSLFAVMLSEQIYRAAGIQVGNHYHK